MARREYPVVRTRLYEPGHRHLVRYDGFGRYDVVADLWRQGRMECDQIDTAELGVGVGNGGPAKVARAMLLDHPDLNMVVCRPFLDTTQGLGTEHFDFQGGAWLPLDGIGIGAEVRHYQYDGAAVGATGAVSRFTLPRNPVVCLSLHRTDPPAGRDWAADPPCTRVELGVGGRCEWCIALPYGGAPYAAKRESGSWERVSNCGKGSRLARLEGYGPDDRLLMWIGVWGGKLVVSTDGFVEDIWVCPSGSGRVEIPEGRIGLWHNAGQWAFSVFAAKMVDATLDSPAIDVGYDTGSCSGQVRVGQRDEPVRSGSGEVLAGVTVVDSTDVRTDLSDTQRAWRAVVVPHTHAGTAPEFRTCVSSELHAVQITQDAELIDTGSAAWSDISSSVEQVRGEHSGSGRASLFELGMDNSLGGYADLSEYRRCSLEAGWMLADGTTEYAPVMDGYLVETAPAVVAGPRHEYSVALIDPMVRLRDERCDARTPAFDGWLVEDVFAWVLDRCGIPGSLRLLEVTGTRLSTGAFDRPLWQVEPGRSWLEFLEEVATFDHRAGLFFTTSGEFTKACRHCRQARTSVDVTEHDGTLSGACDGTVRWELHTRSGPASTPDAAGGILSIERARESLRSADFVNYVAVCGASADGTPVQSVVYEPASLYDTASDVFVGWRKMDVRALETYTTQAETNRLAQTLFQDRSRRPEHVTIIVPLEPAMSVGQVLQVNGAESVGADGHKYRIETVSHEIRRGIGAIASTRVVARWLGEGE